VSSASPAEGQGDLSRRWAELGLVRASQLRGRAGGAVSGVSRGPRSVGRYTPSTGAAAPELSSAPHPVPDEPARPDLEAAEALPVAAPLAGLLPWGGLRRGSTVAVGGSTSLVLAVLAEASRAGSWCALVGLPGLGVQAAAEAGLDLARTALVPRPGPRPAAVVAALVDGVDLVVLGDTRSWRAGDRQRLAARVRQRGAVLIPVVPAPGAWPGADAELHASGGVWSGLAGDGAGRLRTRRVHLRCAARGRAADLRDDVLLPGPGGPCAVPEPEADLDPATELDPATGLDPAPDLDPAIAEAV
jgi:hypothetical protein